MQNCCLITFKKIQKQPYELFNKKAVLRNFAIFKGQTQKHLYWSTLFNSEYCKTFKSTYFEKHRWMPPSENMFMKPYDETEKDLFIRTFNFTFKKTGFLNINMRNICKNVCFYFTIGFPWSLYSHTIFS